MALVWRASSVRWLTRWMTTAARIARITITTSSSMSVNPRAAVRISLLGATDVFILVSLVQLYVDMDGAYRPSATILQVYWLQRWAEGSKGRRIPRTIPSA